jgi:PKD repeat protein
METDFSADQLSGFLPLTVEFTNTCPSTVLSSEWDFDGDGLIDSVDENPIWTYVFPGTYTVSQWVSNGFDSDTEIKQDYITVSLNPTIARYVPTQYSTIQAAINAANDGDYIIIANGTYFENLLIEGKSITLASYYFIDGDSTHIANTIIDGSNALNPDQASTLTILPGSGRPETKPHVIGFTIRNGSGRRIIQNVGGTIVEKRVGGGIYIRQSEPVFSYNKIVDNDADDEGGGSYAFYSVPNLGGMVNPSIGLFNPGMNQFRNNTADIGADIYIEGVLRRDALKIGNCSFEVMSVADTTVSNYWVNSSSSVDFTGSSGRNAAITTDIYVATNGNDLSNSGTSPSSPFKTIDHALSRIYATAENPLTIHLASGTYSPSLTGEKYPLQMVKYVSLQGAGIEESFLDAEASADFPRRVLNLDKVKASISPILPS